jgi:hypothetical protein
MAAQQVIEGLFEGGDVEVAGIVDAHRFVV